MGAQQDLDVFATLAEAVGLTLNGELQGQWFQDPLGTPDGSQRGLSSMMYLDEQREALIAFVDEVLGDPERDSQGKPYGFPCSGIPVPRFLWWSGRPVTGPGGFRH